MLSEDLIFGRENIAYAVLAVYSDAVNEKPVVVSLHLGAKMAYAHIEVIDDPQQAHNQPQRPARRLIRIVRKP